MSAIKHEPFIFVFHSIFLSMIDSKLLEAYVTELKNKPEVRQQYLTAFHDLLQLHISILHLLRCCVMQDMNVQAIVLQDQQVLRHLVLLLGITFTGII